MDMLVVDQTQMNYSPTPSNPTIYLQDFRSEPCQVCGENASGWHCGSITCEACKKFFLRSANDEHRKYKCMKDKKCLISRTTRTQCQYCRYMKCIAVGMKPSEGVPNPKIEDIFKQIPCAICQNPSSGIHFGTTTCEGCKGFFRRTIRERIPQRYKCPEKNNCEINPSTRHACRACRFQKCLAAGMSIEGSRIGRQSNLFKHKMVEMQRRGLIRSQLRHVIASNSHRTNNPSRKKGHLVETCTSLRCFEENFQPMIDQQICDLENAYMHFLKELPFCASESNDLWLICMAQLDEYTRRVEQFAFRINEFSQLNSHDQQLLLHSAVHSVIIFCLGLQTYRYQTLTNHHTTWNYLNVDANSSFIQHLQQIFPFFFDIQQLTYPMEKEFLLLELDEKEIALVISLLITSIVNSKFTESEKIENIQENLFCILFDYMSAKRGIHSKDYFILTVQIPLLHRCNSILAANIVNSKCSFSYNQSSM